MATLVIGHAPPRRDREGRDMLGRARLLTHRRLALLVAAGALLLAAGGSSVPAGAADTSRTTVSAPAAETDPGEPCEPGLPGVRYGTAGADNIAGTAGADTICGLGGNDKIDGGAGDDQIYGGPGIDDLKGSAGNDFIEGGDGADKLSGADGDDTLIGGEGSDSLAGGGGTESLVGEGGADVLSGGDGDDSLGGGDGPDRITAEDGNDRASGGAGDDTLSGQDGDDLLSGDDGFDTVSGNEGTDSCLTAEKVTGCETTGADPVEQLGSPTAPEPAAGTVTVHDGLGGVSLTLDSNGGIDPWDVSVEVARQYMHGVTELLASPAYDITVPSGSPPVSGGRLTLAYSEAVLNGFPEENLRIYTFDQDAQLWLPLPEQSVDPAANTITASINHLSVYAVLKGRTPLEWR